MSPSSTELEKAYSIGEKANKIGREREREALPYIFRDLYSLKLINKFLLNVQYHSKILI